jgi:hypothetical protein
MMHMDYRNLEANTSSSDDDVYSDEEGAEEETVQRYSKNKIVNMNRCHVANVLLSLLHVLLLPLQRKVQIRFNRIVRTQYSIEF